MLSLADLTAELNLSGHHAAPIGTVYAPSTIFVTTHDATHDLSKLNVVMTDRAPKDQTAIMGVAYRGCVNVEATAGTVRGQMPVGSPYPGEPKEGQAGFASIANRDCTFARWDIGQVWGDGMAIFAEGPNWNVDLDVSDNKIAHVGRHGIWVAALDGGNFARNRVQDAARHAMHREKRKHSDGWNNLVLVQNTNAMGKVLGWT